MSLHRIHGASCLSALRPNHDYRPSLDELSALGFDLVRVFCGALPWCGQEIQHVYQRLPDFLYECRARSLHVYQAYITEAGTGYDLDAHVAELEAINAGRDNVLREVANEYDHPTQGGRLSPLRLLDLKDRMLSPAACGATVEGGDESDDNALGDYCSVHRDRGRDKWNNVRRVREIEALSDGHDKPGFDQEPIGADEVSKPGSRESDPAIFFTQAVLSRIFEVGSILHSTDGLNAQPFHPNQRACAEAFMRGYRTWNDESARLTFKNAGWHDSPVKDANFPTTYRAKRRLPRPRPNPQGAGSVVRVYSGVLVDTIGLTCALGIQGDPGIEWQNGWAPVGVIDQMPGVTVWRIER